MKVELKDGILSELRKNKTVEFEYSYAHKGADFFSKINENLYEYLSDWVHEILHNFLVERGVFDNYDGSFIIEKGELFIILKFRGPDMMNEEDIYLEFDEFNLPNSIKTKIIDNDVIVEPENFCFHIEYENGILNNFKFIYYCDNDKELTNDDFNEKEISDFKKLITNEIEENSLFYLYSEVLDDFSDFTYISTESLQSCHCSFDDERCLNYFAQESYKIAIENIKIDDD